jgi:hypothetical protein
MSQPGPTLIDVFERHPGWRERTFAILDDDQPRLARSLARLDESRHRRTRAWRRQRALHRASRAGG